MVTKLAKGIIEQVRNNYTPLICASMIFILALYAMHKGIDGKCFGLAVATIAGLGGYTLRRLLGT